MQQSFFLKNHNFVFSQLHFCRFTFKNTSSCLFKYFESSDVIVVKEKSLLKIFSILMFWLMLKKWLNGSRATGCKNRADDNSSIIILVTIIIMEL